MTQLEIPFLSSKIIVLKSLVIPGMKKSRFERWGGGRNMNSSSDLDNPYNFLSKNVTLLDGYVGGCRHFILSQTMEGDRSEVRGEHCPLLLIQFKEFAKE